MGGGEKFKIVPPLRGGQHNRGNQGGTSLTWAGTSKIYKYVNDTQMIQIDLRQDFLSTLVPFLYYASEIEI